MAITLGVGPVQGSGGGSDNHYSVALNGTTAGRQIMLAIRWYETTDAFTVDHVTISGESNATLHGTVHRFTAWHMAYQFASLADNVNGGDKTIDVVMSGTLGVTGLIGIIAMEVAGGDTSTFYKNEAFSSAGGDPPTVSLDTVVDNALIFMHGSSSAGQGELTQGSGFTLISGINDISVYDGAQYQLDAGTASTANRSFGAGITTWAIHAAAFAPSASGPVSQDLTGLVGGMTAANGDMSTALSNYYFLGSDVTISGWTTSSGTGSLASMLNEATPDDGTYAQSAINPSADIAQCEWLNVSPPDGNTNNQVSYRIWGDGGVTLLVELIAGDGTTVIGGDTSGAGWLHDPAPSTSTQYDKTLSSAEADAWAAAGYVGSRLRVTAG